MVNPNPIKVTSTQNYWNRTEQHIEDSVSPQPKPGLSNVLPDLIKPGTSVAEATHQAVIVALVHNREEADHPSRYLTLKHVAIPSKAYNHLIFVTSIEVRRVE